VVKGTAGGRLVGLLIGVGLVILLVAGGILWFAALHERQPSASPATSDSGASESVNLAWDASPGDKVKGYRILFGPQPGTYTNAVDVGDVTTATLGGLRRGTRYYVVVIAVDGQGNVSPPSNEIQVVVSK